LEAIKEGRVGMDEAMSRLSTLPFEDLGFAKVDHHRGVRKGFPEVVFGAGKTPEQIASVAGTLLKRSDRLLVTRASEAAFEAVHEVADDAVYEPVARAITVDRRIRPKKVAGVAVICAGTADLPVALEACVTAEMMDCRVDRLFDVGVAGLHRLLEHLDELRRANVVVAVAGMDGVLPSVVGGLVSAPVIAVPTSVGYGASFQGLAALLTMLNSCAPGVGVVNIDNGFGAGYLAARINHAAHKAR
jgi:NCAIR mutase (PurE)-related protein